MGGRGVGLAVALTITIIATAFSAFFITRHRPLQPSQRPLNPQSSTERTSPPLVSIHDACQATTRPETCETSLTPPANDSSPNQNHDAVGVLRHATTVAAANLVNAQTMIARIVENAAGNQNLSRVATTCREVLRNAESRMLSTVDALPRGEVKDARAWMSAALVYQVGCLSGLNKTVDALPWVNTTVSYLESVANLTSDALSMIVSFDVYGNETRLWGPPRTERDGFWERVDGSGGGFGLGFNGGFPLGLAANVTVCNGDGEKCDYTTVQGAVNAAPDNDEKRRFVIRVKKGVYNETVRVPFQKKNVVFMGDGMGKTVITGSLNVGQPGMTTYESATVGVLGDGFMAKDLTIQNTAGPAAHQAVAFRSDSDRSVVESCEFIGNQDTLCANSLRQFYKSCRIQGNVDFIFGFSASFFQDCLILVSPRHVSPDSNVVTAHGRFDPAQSTGLVFWNCTVNGTQEYMTLYNKNPKTCFNYLGRPWKEYSRTVFMNCNLGALISQAGWMPWDGDFGLSTLYYGEFENSGPGSDSSKREKWSSQISSDHVHTFSVLNFIQGAKWIPSTSS